MSLAFRFFAGVALVAMVSPVAAAPASYRIHAEVDPLPFLRSGYGGQVGYRGLAPKLRIAVASFSLDVPDLVAQLGSGNDGFHLRVRPSVALYGLYYFSNGRDGFALGGSMRYLRLQYTHDDFANERARVGEFSLEGIVAYKWHPFDVGFYLQPWFAVARTLATKGGDVVVGDRSYSELPLQFFFTVNLGWEVAL